MTAKKNTDWIIMNSCRGGRLECLRCGRFHEIQYPAEMWAIAALSNGFVKEHRKCKAKQEGLHCNMCGELGHAWNKCPKLESKTLQEWLGGPDTGTSSRTVADGIYGRGLARTGASIPLDPGDFGRCYRLVKALSLRTKLVLVADAYPMWGPFVREWDRLAALYEEEMPEHVGSAPKLYALLKTLVAESEGL